MPVKSVTKKTLRLAYGISYPTLRKWLGSVPNLKMDPNKSIILPSELELIYNHLGRPEGY